MRPRRHPRLGGAGPHAQAPQSISAALARLKNLDAHQLEASARDTDEPASSGASEGVHELPSFPCASQRVASSEQHQQYQ
jgi:hypothetical protein